MEHEGQFCMTKGPIGRELLQLTLPVLLSQLLQQFYNIADASVIGQAAGAVGLAAVGSAGLLLSVMVNFFIGLSTGVSVVDCRRHVFIRPLPPPWRLALYFRRQDLREPTGFCSGWVRPGMRRNRAGSI